jgi:ATP-binding cassette subfamily B multidrug efflux pump
VKYRLQRKFIPWVIHHSFEYWYYYLGAILSLYFLHYFQSRIPELAKDLGDKVSEGKLHEVDISYFLFLGLCILFFRTFSRLLFFYPARVQQKNLRIEMLHRLESVLPKHYAGLSDGDLFQRIVNDFNRIRGFIGFALLQIGNIVIASLIFIPKIREFNPDFLIAFSPMVACIILFSILIFFFQPIVRKNMGRLRRCTKLFNRKL